MEMTHPILIDCYFYKFYINSDKLSNFIITEKSMRDMHYRMKELQRFQHQMHKARFDIPYDMYDVYEESDTEHEETHEETHQETHEDRDTVSNMKMVRSKTHVDLLSLND